MQELGGLTAFENRIISSFIHKPLGFSPQVTDKRLFDSLLDNFQG